MPGPERPVTVSADHPSSGQPQQGAYDATRVAAAARQSDPGLPEETAQLLAAQAWEHLRAGVEPKGPALARALLVDNGHAGATAANVVATAAVAFCAQHSVSF